AFRIADNGLFIYCCPQSAVYHYESATSRALWSEHQLERLLHRNRDLFFDRWQHCLAARAKGLMPPQRVFDAQAWYMRAGKTLPAAAAMKLDLKATREVAQLDRHVGYLSAVLTSCSGELGTLRAEHDK